ncbi:glycosyltransferase family 4 protein [Stenotrophomonas sp.]|uniref:glycosyltransferase family 4 protein n=1 Tax=Stenotrophomonas sp. TaxID=69392 RepID=UPI0028AC41F4|nr:glycosyltransferase family 4 protein [Stenotrophomonas sp.]
MKIAFLCKRRYTGKDALGDRFGRLYEVPLQLALLGHEVTVFAVDYHGGLAAGNVEVPVRRGRLQWRCSSIGVGRWLSIGMYPLRLLSDVRGVGPDIVIGASDIPHVSLAVWISTRLKVPCVADLYDNFESFGQAGIPGFKPVFHYALKRADLILAVTKALACKIDEDGLSREPALVLNNGVDRAVFFPGDRDQARARLGLPVGAKCIGTAGGLSRMKGLDVVYAAWGQLSARCEDVHLVLAGPTEPGFPPPVGDRVHYLGELQGGEVADLFRSLDVGLIPIADSAFGRYCFPQKAYEMLACGLPLAVAGVEEMRGLLSDFPSILYRPGDVGELVDVVERQLKSPVVVDVHVKGWPELIADVEPRLKALGK